MEGIARPPRAAQQSPLPLISSPAQWGSDKRLKFRFLCASKPSRRFEHCERVKETSLTSQRTVDVEHIGEQSETGFTSPGAGADYS